jgi:outer membrane protein OmpA-like peptidoglycan-associated protein
MLIVSYGEERPACAERNEACWAKNRRGHFLTKAE